MIYQTRNIIDGVMSLHEILHHTHAKKHLGIVLIYFENASDKVNCDFLLRCLVPRGFEVK